MLMVFFFSIAQQSCSNDSILFRLSEVMVHGRSLTMAGVMVCVRGNMVHVMTDGPYLEKWSMSKVMVHVKENGPCQE